MKDLILIIMMEEDFIIILEWEIIGIQILMMITFIMKIK